MPSRRDSVCCNSTVFAFSTPRYLLSSVLVIFITPVWFLFDSGPKPYFARSGSETHPAMGCFVCNLQDPVANTSLEVVTPPPLRETGQFMVRPGTTPYQA